MTSSNLVLQDDNGIAVLKLNRGVTNAINLELVAELDTALTDLAADPANQGVVLTSANEKFFSIGFDIPHLFSLAREEFLGFYHSFTHFCLDLLAFPKPVLAALNGHAVAGGYILALCCDYRYIAAGHKLVGLNEIKLGVPVPFVADRILHALVSFRIARDVMDGGDFYEAEAALHLGLVDQVLPAAELLSAAQAKAQSLAGSAAQAFALIKRNRIEPLRQEILRDQDEREAHFIELWYSEAGRQRLQEASARF